MMKLEITQTQIDGIRKAKNDLLISELTTNVTFDIQKSLPYAIIQHVRNSYARIIEGLAIGLSVESSELEHKLDDYGLGSHDLKHLLQNNTAMQIYKGLK